MTIYIPYELSVTNKTRYDEVCEMMGPNKNIVDHTHVSLALLINKANVIGLMAPLNHDQELPL